MSDDADVELRRLCYRLRRQGMLELDAWLEPLARELAHGDSTLVEASRVLLTAEPPALLAMMRGERPLPKALAPWLGLGKG